MWQRVQGIGEAFGLGRNGVPPGPVGQFDTDWVREPDRADYYREMLRGLVCPATPERMTAGERPFRVRARNGASGEMLYADYAATPHRFERGPADVSHGPSGCYYVLRQKRPTPGHVQVRGEAVRLAPGECVLGDSDTPLAVCEDSALAFSLYLLPKRLVDPWLAAGRDRLGAGLRLETTSPLAPMLTDALAAATGAGGLAPHTALGVSHVLGRLVAVVADEGAAAEPMRQAVQVARRTQILREIELGFANPLLDPARVARAAGISVRSLHLALEPTGRSFSEHLTERRLTEARRLIDGGLARSVADAAFASGFNDVSTFYRAFRRAFDATPRDLAEARVN